MASDDPKRNPLLRNYYHPDKQIVWCVPAGSSSEAAVVREATLAMIRNILRVAGKDFTTREEFLTYVNGFVEKGYTNPVYLEYQDENGEWHASDKIVIGHALNMQKMIKEEAYQLSPHIIDSLKAGKTVPLFANNW